MPHRFAAIPAALPATIPFVGPDELERRRKAPFQARLGANENGFGPAPAAIEAIANAAPATWKYGDSTGFALKEAIAQATGAPVECVVPGEGIDGLLGLTCRLFLNPGDAAVAPQGGYPTFNYHVAGHGGRVETVPYRADAVDLDALLDRAAQSGAKLVYLSNPDNPMGGWLTGRQVATRLDALPEGALLLHDEAYAEFQPQARLPVDPHDPRVIRFRTFSKAYGLAGLRVGYALAAPAIAAGFDRIRNHFGLGGLAQAAALAALGDRDWLARTLTRVAAARERIAQIARQNDLTPLPSATNFVTVDCGGDGALSRKLVLALEARGVFVRMPGVAPLDRCVRISAAPEAELACLARALPQALAEARG